MFIYAGKLKWLNYAKDELYVVALPNGPVRNGDIVYLFSEWTVSASGYKKGNWFQKLTVDKISKSEDGNDIFTLKGSYYTYEVTSGQNYDILSIQMSNPHGGKDTSRVERVYQSKGDSWTNSCRMWTGKLNWPDKASNEPIIIIVPEGFGYEKPAMALWQWSVENNQPLVKCIVNGVQKEEPGNHQFSFSFEDRYSLICDWEEKTEKLYVNMTEPGKPSQPIGPYDLSAALDPHTHDITPPELPQSVSEKSLTVRWPQAEPSLVRIQTQMPFPRTLMENLTYTASLVDNAGYLAKYAVERYEELDKQYHALGQEIQSCNQQISELQSDVRQLTEENKGEKEKNANLEKQLSDARDAATKREAELTKQIQDLQKTISKDQDHDAQDHKALDEAHKMIEQEQAAKNKLQKELDGKVIELAAAQARVKELTQKVSDLGAEMSDLKGQLSVEKDHNKELQETNQDLKQKLAKAEADLATAQKTLARTSEDLQKAKDDCDDKDKIIEGLENGLVAIKKDRDAKKLAFNELKKSTDATIKDLEDKLAAAKGGSGSRWQPPNKGLFPFSQDTPGVMKQSIANHQSKSSWARMSPWIGNMSNKGTFFNSLERIDSSFRLTRIRVYGSRDWINGFELDYSNGNNHKFGNSDFYSPILTLQQIPEQPIVAATALTDNSMPRAPYQTLANLSLFTFDKENGYQLAGQCAAGHQHGTWMKGIDQTSLAPALDGSWSLRGIYGYYDGSIDAIGFVWGYDGYEDAKTSQS